MLTPYSLFSAQLIAHFAIIPMCLYASFQEWMLSFLVYFFSGCLGMTMTYHRGLAHRAWIMPRPFYYFGLLCASIGLTGSALSWIAIHRRHHRHADTELDPHCPSIKGFLFCQWLSMFSPVDLRTVTDLRKEPALLAQHKYYFLICFLYALILLYFDPFALIYAWLFPAALLWNAGSFVITLGHLWGTKLDKNSNARNNWVLGLLVWGEGWHANHHVAPENSSFASSWWQLDIGGWLIARLEKKSQLEVVPS